MAKRVYKRKNEMTTSRIGEGRTEQERRNVIMLREWFKEKNRKRQEKK